MKHSGKVGGRHFGSDILHHSVLRQARNMLQIEVMLESLGDFLDALEAVVRRTEIGDRKAFRIKPACD
jgi:hypothetical protein